MFSICLKDATKHEIYQRLQRVYISQTNVSREGKNDDTFRNAETEASRSISKAKEFHGKLTLNFLSTREP